MLGDTLTITHNSVSKVLSKINQDNFSTIYQLRSATEEFRCQVRHTVESAKQGAVPFDRHNIEFTHTTYATATVPAIVNVASFVIRTRAGTDPGAPLLDAKALVGWLSDANVTKLIAWES